MYVRPQIEGQAVSFGVSGKLWRDSLMLYDRSTRSLWSQLLGRAVAGPAAGRALEEVPAEVTTWQAWKARHPRTLVLAKTARDIAAARRRPGSAYDDYHRDPERVGVLGTRNPDDRLPGKALVYGIQREQGSAAVPFRVLDAAPVLNTFAFGVPVLIVSPRGENAVAAYERTVDGKVLEFEAVEKPGTGLALRDTAGGSLWAWDRGECVEGPHSGTRLRRIPGMAVYWGVWAQFHPDTALLPLAAGEKPRP